MGGTSLPGEGVPTFWVGGIYPGGGTMWTGNGDDVSGDSGEFGWDGVLSCWNGESCCAADATRCVTGLSSVYSFLVSLWWELDVFYCMLIEGVEMSFSSDSSDFVSLSSESNPEIPLKKKWLVLQSTDEWCGLCSLTYFLVLSAFWYNSVGSTKNGREEKFVQFMYVFSCVSSGLDVIKIDEKEIESGVASE